MKNDTIFILPRNISPAFSVSTYQGKEPEVLLLRNRNRCEPRNRKYLDWRYLGLVTYREPLIFWVNNSNGMSIGMAAFIFRPYRVCGNLMEVGVLGDISLDLPYRGTGLAREWFAFINSYLAQEKIRGLVIPNQAAAKLLAATGWQAREHIVHYVFVLNPTDKLLSLVKSETISKFLGAVMTLIRKRLLAKFDTSEYSIEIVCDIDQSHVCLLNNFGRHNVISIDKSCAYYLWRYDKSQNDKYSIVNILKKNKIVGCVICAGLASDNVVTIYEIGVEEGEILKENLVAFSNCIFAMANNNEIRCPINENHPYGPILSESGFIKRVYGNRFYTISNDQKFSSKKSQWIITAGDKDV